MQDDKSALGATQALDTAPAADAADDSMAGKRIGNYQVRRLIGAGGMGRVYLAKQISPVQREVALKLLPANLASPMARARFDVERQALARMQHPAVARIFDAGTSAEGQAFIAMELVEGVPITRYCSAHQLDRPARLRLFQRVCHGVQHAHQKGVIHRDLKPDNVLVREVDGSAWPTLIDFGIAIGSGGRSHERERAGTVAYMSPEQLAGDSEDIDTRSDVYALGVMLFEVLVGGDAVALTTGMFRSDASLLGAGASSGVERVAEGKVQDLLLQAASGLPAELRAVLRKALAPTREARYESAAALSDDLGRYLRNEPLGAVPATRAYRLRKFIARHRVALAVSLLVFAALVAGIVLALEGQHRAERAAAAAQVQTQRAERVSGFVSTILSGVDPDIVKGQDSTLMRMVLDDAATRVGSELAREPEVRASIEHTIAKAYTALGLFSKAVTHNQAAVDAAREAGLPPVRQAQMLIGLAANKAQSGADPDAYLAAVQRAQQLIAGAPEDDPARLSVENDIALLDWRVGNLEAALAILERVVPLQRALLAPDSRQLAAAESMLALVYSDMGNYEQAEPLYRDVLDRALQHHGEVYSDTVHAVNELAINQMRQQRFAEAEKLLRHYLPIATRLYGETHPFRMGMYSNLGGAIRQQGRNEEARPYYENALRYALDTDGPASYLAVLGEANLAFLLRDIGELEAAEQHTRAAIAHMDAVFGTTNGARGQFFDLLGTILTKRHDYPQARDALDRAWQIFTTASGYGSDHPAAQDTVKHQIELYQAWNKPDKVAAWRARLAAPEAANP